MIASTRSRAAVLCLGGWGLQTMLHLWPRLMMLQEAKHLLNSEGKGGSVEVGRTSAFAAILPRPLGGSGLDDPFSVLRPHPDHYPPPFFVEQELTDIFRRLDERESGTKHSGWTTGNGAGIASASAPGLLYSELVGLELLERALGKGARSNSGHSSAPYLELIRYEAMGGRPAASTPLTGDGRVRRKEMFAQGLAWSEVLVRALLRYVVDPTRLDEVNPHDPFVRTNLYVVASLAEPLASALIWPIISELTATLGPSNVVKVIAVLATGSFAPGVSQPVEEAATHIALAELEALQGMPGRDDSTQAIRSVVASVMGGKPAWEQRVGKPLFDYIYLIDREKSNQSLARDSLELSVLAANAIEAFLAADGDIYIDQQLGYRGVSALRAPYSLIGAANNYVPLSAYLHAAIDEERKRIVREGILVKPVLGPGKEASLKALKADTRRVYRDLVELHIGHIFGRVSHSSGGPLPRRLVRTVLGALDLRGRRRQEQGFASWLTQSTEEGWLPYLHIRRAAIFPATAEAQMRDQPTAWRWRAIAEAQADQSIRQLEQSLRNTYLAEAWGLQYATPQVTDEELKDYLAEYHLQTWAQRRRNDTRALPRAVHHALKASIGDICASPGGLAVARTRLDSWMNEISELIRTNRISDRAQVEAWDEQDRNRYRLWQRDFVRVAGGAPHAAASGIRAVLGSLFLTYLVVGWLLFEAPPPVTMHHYMIAGVAVIGVLLMLGMAPNVIWWLRMRRVRRKRIHLALERAEHIANRVTREALSELYSQLHSHLQAMRDRLDVALEKLQDWAQPEDPVQIPPTDALVTHLRVPRIDNRIWSHIKDRLRTHQAPGGMGNFEWLSTLWVRHGRDLRQWDAQGTNIPQLFRLSLERDLNEVELPGVQQLEARLRALSQSGSQTQAPVQQNQPAAVPTAPPGDLVEPTFQGVRKDQEANAWCGFAGGSPQATPPPECTACRSLNRFSCPFSKKGRTEESDWSIDAIVHTLLDEALEYLVPKKRVLPDDRELVVALLRNYSIEKLLFGAPAHRGDLTLRRRLLSVSTRTGAYTAGSVPPNGATGANGANGGNWPVDVDVDGAKGKGRTSASSAVRHVAQEGATFSPGKLAEGKAGHLDASRELLIGEAGPENPVAFMESLWARAKPSAYSDVAVEVAPDVQPVDFVVTENSDTSILHSAIDRRSLELLSSSDPLSITAVLTVNGLSRSDLALTDQYREEHLRLDSSWHEKLLLLEPGPGADLLYGPDSSGIL